MIKKRVFLVVMAVLMTVLAACGDKNGESNEDSNDATSSVVMSGNGIQTILDRGYVNVGCKADIKKFGYQNTSTGEYEGFEIDLAYEIAAEIFGCTSDEAKSRNLCRFTAVTAATRGELLDNGTLDMVIATYTIKPERLESWNFSTPYYNDYVGLMTLKDENLNTIADLDDCIVGVAQGASTENEIENYIASNNIDADISYQEFDTYPLLCAALFTGNIDAFAVDRSILSSYMNDSTMIMEERFGQQQYGIATRLNNKDLSEFVDQIVNDRLKDGTINSLIEKWEIQ